MKKRESVRHIMALNPIVLYLTDGLSQAEKLFKKHRVRHLPVVSGAKIVGMLSMTDIKYHKNILYIPPVNRFN